MKHHNQYIISFIIPIHFLNNKINKKIQNFIFLEKKYPVQFIFIFSGIKKNLNFKYNKNFYFLKKNLGPGPARNLGIKMSKGKWICFLDSDDDINIKNLYAVIKDIRIKNNNFCSFNFETNQYKYKKNIKKFKLNYKKMKIKKRIKLFLCFKIEYSVIFYFFKKKFLINNQIFFDKGFYEDILFLIKVYFFNKNKKIFHLNKLFYYKNINPNSITAHVSKKYLLDYIDAWLSVMKFLKENYKKYEEILGLNQYCLRGVFGFWFKKISNQNLKKEAKKRLINILISKLKSHLDMNFIPKTKYDRCVKNYIN